MRPERRTIRYATFDETAIKAVPAPSDSDVQTRYKLNVALYAPSETRSITQVIVPTEPAAKALAAEIAGGKSIEAAAASKGLSTSKQTGVTRQALEAQSSGAVAAAVFAAEQGKLAAPAKGALGWFVIRLDAIVHNPGKTLDQARGEIVAALTAEKRRAALADVSAGLDDQFSRSTGLADAAKSMGLTLTTTDPIQADGSVPSNPGIKPSPDVAPLVQAAFAMEREGQPQVAELQAGSRYVIFDVGQITPAAPPPLSEVREKVLADLTMARGNGAAKAAADKILAALARKVSLADAVKGLGADLPAAQAIAMSRQQLTAMQQRVPAPLALMFAMAQGTAKRLEAPGKAGWLVVRLDRIIPGAVAADDPLIAQARSELGGVVAREYADELRAAVREAVGVKRNEAAISAVRTQLLGGQ
jgi:peptidyl-prolyl cis-trans isomerase D